MTKKTSIKRTPGDGFDRIEWLDAAERTRKVRASSPEAVAEVQPARMARTPSKYMGQSNYQGHYWCRGTRGFVFHESMTEYSGLMLLDHLHRIRSIAPQPMLLSFADGTIHYPDYFAVLEGGRRLLVDVHAADSTTDEDRHKFELTRQMCARVGWDYELIDELDEVARFNVEWVARYRHPRHEPTAELCARVVKLATPVTDFESLRQALKTAKPGEHLPALYHLLWNRELLFDLTKPFTKATRIWAAA